jgi:phosphoribosyl 1,2-cyclic phosphodiesterase
MLHKQCRLMMSDKPVFLSNSAVSQDSGISLCMLASGSKGNSIYVSDGATAILVDAGLSGIEIERRLKSRNLSPESLDAIVVSHEHEDHIRGVGVLSRRYGLPVYISAKTLEAAPPQLKNLKEAVAFQCGASFYINTLNIHPFSISHDAADPAGFTIALNQKKIGIATDLGIATAMVRYHLQACDLLILEANHDPEMLFSGPYPWHLKQRVNGRTGHLSNQDSRMLLEQLQHQQLQHVILAHLSETNNTPEKALAEVCPAINPLYTQLTVSSQDICSQLVLLNSSPSESCGGL